MKITNNIPILTKEDIKGVRDYELERLKEAYENGRVTLVWYETIKGDVQRRAEELLNNLNN